jgi:hypothetical protein
MELELNDREKELRGLLKKTGALEITIFEKTEKK